MVMVNICNNLILYTMYCLFCDMFCSLMYASSGLINKGFEFEFETKFLKLAMSLLDVSPRIPLGTFSILLH